MSLMKLTPESERLRRLAKAHAAGELATPEYRQMRAEVIERFGGTTLHDPSDVTERRAGIDTERAIAKNAAPPAAEAQSGSPRARWPRVALGIGALALLCLVAWHAFAGPVL